MFECDVMLKLNYSLLQKNINKPGEENILGQTSTPVLLYTNQYFYINHGEKDQSKTEMCILQMRS